MPNADRRAKLIVAATTAPDTRPLASVDPLELAGALGEKSPRIATPPAFGPGNPTGKKFLPKRVGMSNQKGTRSADS